MMHQVPQPRLTLPAVAGRLERGVRRHRSGEGVAGATDETEAVCRQPNLGPLRWLLRPAN